MISTLHKTVSGAWSSFTSAKEPRLLERTPSCTLSQPNDPAISPSTAHMPPSRSSTSSNKDKKSQKGQRAAEFLRKHFNAAEDDPIETSPQTKVVRRIKSTPHAARGKKQAALLDSVRLKKEASKPEITHKQLLVDADERSLFPGNAPVSDAVYIPRPGSTTSDRKSASATMRSRPFRPPNTLDGPKSSSTFNGSRDSLQESCSKRSGSSRYTSPMLTLNSDFPTRMGTSEPPSKRQRIDPSPRPYVTNGGVGAKLASFSPTKIEGLPLNDCSSKSPAIKHFGPSKGAVSSPLAVTEYQSVEETMQSNSLRKRSTEVPPGSVSKPTHGHRQRSEESDPEKFTRDSKRTRYRHSVSEPSDTLINLHESTGALHGQRDDIKTTPPGIRDIFGSYILPSDEGISSAKARELFDDPSAADPVSKQKHGDSAQGVWKGPDLALTGGIRHRPPVDIKNAASNKPEDRPTNNKTEERKFSLRYLQYGFIPDEKNYVASISGDMLQITYPESTLLSKDPLWSPVHLSKIVKIYHGSEDCLRLMLHFSQCQGQPNTKMHLELSSKEDKDDFLSLMPTDLHKTLRVRKDDEYMRKCFERNAEEAIKNASQPHPRANFKHQLISNPRQVSGTTSPHFQNQRTLSSNTSRPAKLVGQLQSSCLASKNSTTASASPTVVTGQDRANESSIERRRHNATACTKRTVHERARSPSTSRLRSSSSKIPATSPSLRSKMSTIASEDGLQAKKNSETHGFGEPWKSPLIYPKAGKRRMAVEHEDLYRLDEDEFLNDNLIGFFLRYLEYHLEQTNPEMANKVYFYNSYFFDRLMQTSKAKKGINYVSVQKWTRNVDIFCRDFVVVPVNENLHWYVVIICNLSQIKTVNDDDMEEEVQTRTPPSGKVATIGREEGFKVRKGVATEEGYDQPTEKTTESLSHLSLSDHAKQVDELAPSTNALPSVSSPGTVSSPRKSGPGRRKAARRSLPKYDISAPVIMTFDSLGAARSSTCTALRQYVVEEAKNKKGWDIDGSHIKGMTAKGIPTQPNYSDCGLYLCAYMEKFILDPALFVGKILQREMDPSRDVPLMASEELRDRMRGMIIELHHEQEGEETEFPVPEVGRILLAPMKAVPSDDVSVPRTPVQDDSEDELQQDQTKLGIVSIAQSPSVTAPVVESGHDQTKLVPAAPRGESPPSETVNTMTEIIAKINGNEEGLLNSDSGTKETAITIDDDEDPQPKPQKGSARKDSTAKDGFPEHPAELKDTTTASNTSAAHRKAGDAITHARSAHRQSQSRASVETVTTEYLSGSSNKSYRHDERDTEHDPRAKAGHFQEQGVLMVPDSQQSGSQETGEEPSGKEGVAAEAEDEDEPNEILEGIE